MFVLQLTLLQLWIHFQTLSTANMKMENISVLNKFTLPFQFFGLQTFTLGNVKNKKSNSKYPSKIFWGFVLFWIVMALIFFVFLFEQFLQKTKANKNYLAVVFNFFSYFNYSLPVLVGAVLTFVHHSKLCDFFQKSEKISNLCSNFFGFEIDYRKMEKGFSVFYVFNVVFFSFLIIHIGFEGASVFWRITKLILSFIIGVYIQMIIIRFNFYVQVVNFHLKILINLISNLFASKENWIQDHSKVKIINIRPRNLLTRQEIVIWREIYLLIKEMSFLINQSMGFIIFLQVVVEIVHMIRIGHEFLRDIHESLSTWSRIWREW